MTALTTSIQAHTNTTNDMIETEQFAVKKTPVKKLTSKEIFQKKHGLYEDKNHFLVAVTTPLFERNNAEIWSDLLPGISDMGFQMVLRANASPKYKDIMEAFTEDHVGLCSLVSEDEFEDIYDAADVLVTFSKENETQDAVEKALSKGVIPILANDFPLSHIENYNPNLENGNAFVYHKKSVWSVFAALVRAYENYRFPYDWKNICKAAVKSSKK